MRDLFGLGSLLPSGSSARQLEAGGGGGDGGGVAQRLLGRLAGGAGGVGGISEEAYYAAARSTMEAAMDEAQQRALWDRFRLH